MSAVDIEKMNLVELRAHRDVVDAKIKQKEIDDRQEAIAAARAAAKALGFEVEDLFGFQPAVAPSSSGKEAKEGRQKVAPKYRNPNNPEQTWTGRGRPPKWVEEQEEAGRKREEFLIEK